jgi:hypothetical protein
MPREVHQDKAPGSVIPCIFKFPGCSFSSTSTMEWKSYGLTHFKRAKAPIFATCPTCEAYGDSAYEGFYKMIALDNLMEHIINHYNWNIAIPDFSRDVNFIRYIIEHGNITSE